jgi:hypothetical protein
MIVELRRTEALPTKPKPTQLQSSKKEEEEEGFSEIVRLIAASREKALQAVNTALIGLYWEVGGIISRKIAAAEWGDAVVDRLAAFLAKTEPGLCGFTRRNLFRMRQFYEAYRKGSIVSPLVAQLPCTQVPRTTVDRSASLRQQGR